MCRRHFITYCEYINRHCPRICQPNIPLECEQEIRNPVVCECNCKFILKSECPQCLCRGEKVHFHYTFHNTDCPIFYNDGRINLIAGAYLINFSCIKQGGRGQALSLCFNDNVFCVGEVNQCCQIEIKTKVTVLSCRLSIINLCDFMNISNAILSIVRLY